MSKTLQVSCDAMPIMVSAPALELRKIEGTERLSESFTYWLTLVTPDDPRISEGAAANVDFKKLVGKEMTVKIELEGKGLGRAGAGTREISGLITAARFVRTEDRRGVYTAKLCSWLELTKRSSDYRLFQKMSALEIIQAVLGGYSGGNKTASKPGYNFPLENRTSEVYPVKDFWVQYGETDFDFVNRLMQEWGIYYFFEHKDGKHKLILVDAAGAHQPNPSSAYHKVAFYPPGHKIDEEYLNEIDFTESLASGVWVTNEFDFKKPKMDLKAKTKLPRNTAHNSLEMYSWPSDSHNPESPTSTDEAKHLTRIKLEQAGSLGQRASAKGNLRGMVVGSTFTLAEYLNSQYNDKDYLIIANHFSLTDVGASSGQERYKCECELEIQPANHIYRAPFDTPLPKTSGPQTAIITGPQGREIYTDQYGRVKLSFLWHRYCTKDENSSCWIRVNYPWAGNGFGGINIPRIGQEVIVDFENGDPDRPIVTGRVYNALNMPPWDLPANATQSGMLSRSSEGAGSANANAIRMEDMKGSEEIWIHAEKDQRIEVENCESHSVGVDRSKTIGNDETVSVGHDRKENVGNDETIGIGHDRKETVGNNETISIGNDRKEDVGNNETIDIGSNRSKTVGKNEKNKIGKNWSINVGMMKTETIGMAYMQNVGLGKMVNIGAAYNLNVGAMMMTNVGMNQDTTVGQNRTESAGENHDVSVGKIYSLTVGEAANVKVTKTMKIEVGESSISLSSDGSIEIKGKKINIIGSDLVDLDGKTIDIN